MWSNNNNSDIQHTHTSFVCSSFLSMVAMVFVSAVHSSPSSEITSRLFSMASLIFATSSSRWWHFSVMCWLSMCSAGCSSSQDSTFTTGPRWQLHTYQLLQRICLQFWMNCLPLISDFYCYFIFIREIPVAIKFYITAKWSFWSKIHYFKTFLTNIPLENTSLGSDPQKCPFPWGILGPHLTHGQYPGLEHILWSIKSIQGNCYQMLEWYLHIQWTSIQHG